MAIQPQDLLLGLSVWQPWAWAIFEAGKDVENRGTCICRQHLGPFVDGVARPLHPLYLAIQAAGGFDAEGQELLVRWGLPVPRPRSYRRNAVIGTALLDFVVDSELAPPQVRLDFRHRFRWLRGARYGLFLADRFLLPDPVPCAGFPGLFRLPPDVERRVRQMAGE